MRPGRKALQKLTLGLRREDPHRIWERRAPLTPDAVNKLIEEEGVEVVVEPCERRVFTNGEYEKAGAKIGPSLDHAHLIIGIKETPMDALARQRSPVRLSTATNGVIPRTHVMFSHTAKGQPYNTGLLSQFVAPTDRVLGESALQFEKTMELWPRLIDYELLTNEEGKRTVGFGWFAGVAGVLESLSAMAHAHLELGIASPFLYTPRPHTLPSLERLRAALREVGLWISTQGTPKALGPVAICVTGSGNVAKGSLSMLEELPLRRVSVNELEALARSEEYDNTKIYLVHAKPQDYFIRKGGGGAYNRQEYYANPSEWESVFGDRIMPYVTLLINGTGWSNGYPRLLSTKQLSAALAKAQALNLPGAISRGRCIGDISCDIGGGLEFLEKSTTLSEPTYRFSVAPSNGHSTMMSVDILPTALPLDASQHFSKEFYPYLCSLIKNVKSNSNEWKGGKYAEALERATMASSGKLRLKHMWLQPKVDEWHLQQRGVGRMTGNESDPVQMGGTGAIPASSLDAETGATATTTKKKRVLMFGSGMVAGPTVLEIAKRGDIDLVIATNMLGEAQQLAIKHGQENNNIKYRIVDVGRKETYEHLVKDADVVISLLPALFHVEVAEMCIENKKHLVTASYISEGMRNLHDRALQADVLLLNEIGLDPGIDHCSAISLVNNLKAKGKEVVALTSFCGGLPAPDSILDSSSGNAVPLKYKFSWSPVGVLRAANQGVRYLLNGRVVRLLGEDLLRSGFPRLPIPLMKNEGVELEGMPNRDSLPYCDTYGLQGGELRTLVRGTLRYPGFCSLMQSFKDLGLLEDQDKVTISSWSELLPTALSLKLKSKSSFGGVDMMRDNRTLEAVMQDIVPWDLAGKGAFGEAMSALEWLGLWSPVSLSSPARGSDGVKWMNGVIVPMTPYTPLELFAVVLAHRLRYAATERDMVVLSHEVVTRSPSADIEEVHKSTLVAYGDESASAMARTVGLPVAFAALDVLDGKVKMRGVTGPGQKEVYENVLTRLEEVGLGMVESVENVKVGSGSGTVEDSLCGSSM